MFKKLAKKIVYDSLNPSLIVSKYFCLLYLLG